MKLEYFIKKLFEKHNKIDDFIYRKIEGVETRLLESARLNATIDPKVRSGDLWKSIRIIKKQKIRSLSMTLTAGDNVAYYAPFLEKGTDDGRLYARWFLRNAYEGTKTKVPKELKKIAKIFLDDI